MADRSTLLAAAGVGAGLMYFVDPERGRRRRALVRDQMVRYVSKSDDAIGATARDIANRARGLAAEALTLFRPDDSSDAVVAERVRSELGHWVSHPGAIAVKVTQGRATLEGPILASEVDDALAAVRGVRGVRELVNRLEVHKQPDNVPGLQGGVGRTGRRFELLQSNWSPTARVVMGGTGMLLAAGAVTRPGVLRGVAGLLGLGMIARAASNIETKRLLGVGGGRRAVDFQKTLTIAAPPETVFDFWSNYHNFPRFMSNVREVRELGGGRSHWTVAGPAGVPVEWDAEVTRLVPNVLLAWRTLAGSTVEHAGIVRFQRNTDGTTTLDIRMSYNPPAGALGHTVAALFGADPKSEIDADLVRMKTLIESGRPARDAARPEGAGTQEYAH